MDATEMKFGDKIFAYGRMTDYDMHEEIGLENPSYNSVLGYMPIGGFYIIPEKTDRIDVYLPGFVMDYIPSLASQTLFAKMEMVNVTKLLSLQEPTLKGTNVWMPIP